MRRALIVDDSRTAQIRLKKMLGLYDLEVDTALSGEDALAYLSYRTPVVIFMDHSMEGMDGFEALKIIKANPSTAMIPVIMYTAQKGDVYVGQARALGALDILSKEVIKPSNLERVLRTLNIRPQNSGETQAPLQQLADNATPRHPEAESKKSQEDSNLNQIRSQIARLFEIHIADVRTQITENTKFIVRRLSRDLDKRLEEQPSPLATDVPAEVVDREVAAERTRLGLVSSSLLLLILLGLASLAWLQFDTRELVTRQVPTPVTGSTNEGGDELRAFASELAELRNQLREEKQINRRLLGTLTWALENDLRFSFNTPPLGEDQVNKLYSLVYMLDNSGFRGTVMLEIHFGNFCLSEGVNGSWVLAPANTPATACIHSDDLALGLEEAQYLSIEYLNFEQSAAPLVNGNINLDIDMVGNEQPRYPYPPLTSQTTAAEWNAAAARNNRLSVQF